MPVSARGTSSPVGDRARVRVAVRRCSVASFKRNETISTFYVPRFLVVDGNVGYSGVRECVWSLVCRFVWGLSTILRYLWPAHDARSRRLCKLAQGEAFCDLTVGCDGIASKRL
jgi:hypothetical protein